MIKKQKKKKGVQFNLLIHGYEFTLNDKPNPEESSIKFQILFQPIEVKINDKVFHLGRAINAQKFALEKANEMLKKNGIRSVALSTGDEMRYIEQDIIADGFQKEKIKSDLYVTIPLKNCEGDLLRFK